MWELDYKESWAPKNQCFWTVVLKKTLERPLHWKEIQPVHSKGNQSWVFIGRTDVEAETPILWPPDAKNWLIGKDPDAGKDWRQEEKGMTEDEMVGWHHPLDGHEFELTPGVGLHSRLSHTSHNPSARCSHVSPWSFAVTWGFSLTEDLRSVHTHSPSAHLQHIILVQAHLDGWNTLLKLLLHISLLTNVSSTFPVRDCKLHESRSLIHLN